MVSGAGSSAYPSKREQDNSTPQDRLPSFSTLFGRDDAAARGADQTRSSGLPTRFPPLNSYPPPSPPFSTLKRPYEQPRHITTEDSRHTAPSSSSSSPSSSSLAPPNLPTHSWDGSRRVSQEMPGSSLDSSTTSSLSQSDSRMRVVDGRHSSAPEQLPGLRDLSLLSHGITTVRQPLPLPAELRHSQGESQRLLDIFYHLRSENRARGIRPAAGEAVPSARLIEHGDCNAIGQFIDSEFAAIAAHDGEHIAAQVADSYGLRSPSSPHHELHRRGGRPASLHIPPTTSSSQGYMSSSPDPRSAPYSLGRSPPSPLVPATPSHPSYDHRSHHHHHHARTSAGNLSLSVPPSSSWPSDTNTSLERRQTFSGPPSEYDGAHTSSHQKGGSVGYIDASSSTASSGYLPLGASGAGAADGSSTDSSCSEALRGGGGGGGTPVVTSGAGPSRRSKARRRVMKREGEVPTCLGCGRLSTAEWRRGPTGPRTLCNACGLLYAKMSRVRKNADGAASVSNSGATPSTTGPSDGWLSLEELRVAVGASSKGPFGVGPTPSIPSTVASGTQGPSGGGNNTASRQQRHPHRHHQHPHPHPHSHSHHHQQEHRLSASPWDLGHKMDETGDTSHQQHRGLPVPSPPTSFKSTMATPAGYVGRPSPPRTSPQGVLRSLPPLQSFARGEEPSDRHLPPLGGGLDRRGRGPSDQGGANHPS